MFLNVLCQPLGHVRLLLGIQPHPFFRTTPQCIFCTANPLVLDQVFQLGFIEFMAKIFAQLGNRSRFADDPFRVAAIGA